MLANWKPGSSSDLNQKVSFVFYLIIEWCIANKGGDAGLQTIKRLASKLGVVTEIPPLAKLLQGVQV